MEFTTDLGLQSQTTRLLERGSWSAIARPDGALTLFGALFQGTWTGLRAEDASLDYNSQHGAEIFKLGSSRFTRRY